MKSIAISCGALSALSVLPLTQANAKEKPQQRPNFLVIMVDEMRWNAMGCEGDPIVRTPNLDRLAATGVRFANMYSVSPVSCPARKSLFTGRYPHVHGVTGNDMAANDGELDLPLILRHYGYRTAIAGKLHFTPITVDWGFDYFWTYHLLEGPRKEQDYVQYMLTKYKPADLRSVPGPFPKDPMGRDLGTYKYPVGDFEANWLTDRSIDFLRMQRGSDQPFFLFTSILQPHSNYVGCEPYASMYKPSDMPYEEVDPAAQKQRLKIIEDGGDFKPARGIAPPPEVQQAAKAAYYGHVTCVDDNIGRLMAELERLGLDKNTVVIFTADHGNMLGEHSSWFKGKMYEGSSHIPLLVKAPAGLECGKWFKPGSVVPELIEQTDIMPTILDMASLAIPAGVQGKSFLTLMKGGKWKNCVYSELTDYMLIEDGYKLIVNRKDRRNVELYRPQEDRREKNNLAADPAHKERIARMLAKIDVWQAQKPAPPEIKGLEKPAYLFRANLRPEQLNEKSPNAYNNANRN